MRRSSTSTLFPYTTLFRSGSAGPRPAETGPARPDRARDRAGVGSEPRVADPRSGVALHLLPTGVRPARHRAARSEEHTSELQSHSDIVCRLMRAKKN